MHVTGIVLAAGAGTRAGGPKARRPGWLESAVAVLLDAGCADVIVVLGAAPNAPVPDDSRVRSVIAHDWHKGMSHSLRAGLVAAAEMAGVDRAIPPAAAEPDTSAASATPAIPATPATPATPANRASPASPATPASNTEPARGVLVTLVDYPDMPASVAARVLAADGPLRQAVYDGTPGHPVFLASEHWAPLASQVHGDRGARPYLQQHSATEVECGDLWHGQDRDH
jgi:CTP:molybdopterin cytidylyltransferase MocA